MLHKVFDIEVKERREDGGQIVISTDMLDRDRDRMLPGGARIENYLKNPVVQWGHNYREPWAVIGKTNSLEISGDKVVADFGLRPAANENDPQNVVLLLWNGGWVRTASIGFDPAEWRENEEGGRDYTVWELLEWSLVPIPANQEALRLAVKAFERELGIGDWGLDNVNYHRTVTTDPDVFYRDDGISVTVYPVGIGIDVKRDEVEKPYANEHACRLRNPGDFESDSFRRVSRRHEGKEYFVIMGRLRGEMTMTEQAYRYPKDGWPVEEARKHCKAHDGQEFSPATGERAMDDELIDEIIQKFAGSPRNPFGTHSSYQFKGGASGYKAAWRCHFSKVGGGGTSGEASAPIRGTVRRVAMIAAGMKPPCQVVGAEGIPARTGPKSPLDCTFPDKPSDYGLSEWKKPETDADREGVRLSCSDLNVIKRAAVAEIKRRIADREEGKTEGQGDDEAFIDETPSGDNAEHYELTPEEEMALAEVIGEWLGRINQMLGGCDE